MRSTLTSTNQFTRLAGLVLLSLGSKRVVASPQPISLTTGPNFLGYDGSWSPILLRVGDPEQWVYVLPNTISSELDVIGQDGCDGTVICQSARGGLFVANESSTFRTLGLDGLGFDLQLGTLGSAYYGSDTIALNDASATPNQLVGVVNSTQFWLGELGLSVVESRFEGTEDHLSLLSSLVQTVGLIPSHSYGYTAGASYRQKGIPASLTLGGVDANRFVPNNAVFTLAQDYVPVLAINSISLSASAPTTPAFPIPWTDNPMTLLAASDASLFTIDTSTPFLWMPESVCDNFAKALNLTYSDELDLYLYNNNTSPSDLSKWNLTFTFSLANEAGAVDGVEIQLPYGAFDLALTYPFPNLNANFSSKPTDYFPLRRASNDTQFTIGRAFLQEAFLQVDYERNNFAVFQALFDTEPNILAITRPDNSTWAGPLRHSSLTTGAEIGIGVGVAVLASVLTAAILLFNIRRYASRKPPSGSRHKLGVSTFFDRIKRLKKPHVFVPELPADKCQPFEIQSSSRFELDANTPVEMYAGEVPSAFFEASSNLSQRQLISRDTACKDVDVTIVEKSDYSTPAYSQSTNPPIPAFHSTHTAPQFVAVSSLHVASEDGVSPLATSTMEVSDREIPLTVSPISPGTVSTFPGSTKSTGASVQKPGSRGGNLAVPPPGTIPSRSSSRNGRVQEEGLIDHTNESNSSLGRTRFSWEHDG